MKINLKIIEIKPQTFLFVSRREAILGRYWAMGRCENCVTINIRDSLNGGTLMMLLA